MARSSPGVLRVAAILDFMADHPGQSFALTDLIRALRLSRATCHALLTSLVEVGYLYRTSNKTYVLGPGIARICRAASDHFSPLQVAQPEMRSLADEYDVVCSAFFLEGDTVIVRDRASSMSHVGSSVPAGTRLKLRPPLAAPFFAWSSKEEVEAWLRTAAKTSAEDRRILEDSMAFARKNDFVLFTTNADAPSLEQPPEQVFGGETVQLPVLPATAIDPKKQYPVASVLAPVFDTGDNVAFVMGLMSFDRSMSGAEALKTAGHLKSACERITNFIGGRRRAG